MMPFVNIKKQYLAAGMLIFVVFFFFNTRPAIQCQFSTDVSVSLPTIYAITPTYKRLAQKADLTSLASVDQTSPAIQCQFSTDDVSVNLSTIYAITPTYKRLAQKADLTRLSQTLMHVKNFHWIVVEDSVEKTDLVTNLLKESTLKFTHLNVKTHKAKQSTASGVEQRNLALEWLRNHLATIEDKRGVVYFMDDDNTYSLKIFDEMRKIQNVGTWPVGLVGGMRVEMPIVTDGKITGFTAVWKPFRPFPIDMAGFAINATLFLDHPDAKFSRKVQSGFQESEILKYFTTQDQLEPLADNCTKVYVWHTRTQRTPILSPKKIKRPTVSDAHIEV